MRSLALRSQFAILELRSNRRSGYSLYSLPCRYACNPPCPEPEGKDSSMGRPPVETISLVAEQPSQPTTRRDAIVDDEAYARRNGHTAVARSTPGTSRAWPPHIALHCEQPAAQQCRQQPAGAPHLHRTRPRRTNTQTPQKTSSPHSHGRPPRARPPRLALGAKTRPRSL